MAKLDLHKVLHLYDTPDKFFIQPVDKPNEALIIDRQTCEIIHNNVFSVGHLPANATSSLIYGLIGIKYLIKCPYLLVITKASPVGMVCGESIYRMDQAKVIPFNSNYDPNYTAKSQDSGGDWNNIYVSMLEQTLQTPHFYFSYSYDLTNTMQRRNTNLLNSKGNDFSQSRSKPHHYYNPKFLWNAHLMDEFERVGEQADNYRLPFILGFVSINSMIPLGHGLSWSIISRRSVKRAGTRFNSRGIDFNGNVSNFVETEQILEGSEYLFLASFVQVRGSIPLVWSQRAINYKYKPVIEISTDHDHDMPMRKHFDELRSSYGNVSVVNLIDQRGHEGNLEHEFSRRIGNLQKTYYIPYHFFDFHKECSKMRWHRLSILIDRIHPELENYGYFAVQRGEVIERQSGIIRSNCIDSLDRTNVVQSLIAQKILRSQLERFNVIPIGSVISNFTNFMDVFNNTWADNADALSNQYAGTPALKTDFTRKGRRTQTGLVKDGVNSLTRYVKNNFYDNYRQDAIDLFLGHFEGWPSPLYRPMQLTSYTSTLSVTFVALTLIVLYFYLRYY